MTAASWRVQKTIGSTTLEAIEGPKGLHYLPTEHGRDRGAGTQGSKCRPPEGNKRASEAEGRGPRLGRAAAVCLGPDPQAVCGSCNYKVPLGCTAKEAERWWWCKSSQWLVNLACEVTPNEQRDLIWRNVCEGTRNKMQRMGMALAMAEYIEPMIHGWGWWGSITWFFTPMNMV